MAKDIAIILNNGNINSAVVTAMAAQRYRPVMMFGDSRSPSVERMRASFEQQVGHFKPYREYTVPPGPSLTTQTKTASNAADPRLSVPLGPQMLELLPLIAVAVNLAAQHQASSIYVGMRVGPGPEDLAQATEFFQVWNELIQLPCGQTEMEIVTPLLELEPWQVVDAGFQVGAPFERTWSCLEESGEPCWACIGCRAREAAFTQAAKPDPIRQMRKV